VPGSGTGWLEWEIVRQHGLVAATMQADPFKPYTNEQFAAHVEGLLTFARERAAFVLSSVPAIGSAAARRMAPRRQR
jgi:hypothetical protein